jgi:hypothetical protein
MPINLIISPDRVNNPFEAARRDLLKRIAEASVPAPYGSWPEPEDHEAVKDHIRDFSVYFDEWLMKMYQQVQSNSAHNVDRNVFDGAYVSAVEGLAMYEVQAQGEMLADDLAEHAL